MSTIPEARPLPNLHGTGRRAAVERALQLWVDRSAFWRAEPDHTRAGRYRVVTGNGTLWEGLTLKEAELLCHGAASAWGRATR